MNLGNTLVLTLLVAAASLCGTVSLIFAATLGEGESLIELIFWPVVGFIGFSALLIESWRDLVICEAATPTLRGEK